MSPFRQKIVIALAALPLAAPARAAEKKVQLFSVGGWAPRYSTRLLDDFEQAVREDAGAAAVREVETYPASRSGAAYRFEQAPAGAPETVPALESADGFLFLYPPQPELLARAKARAEADHFLPPFYERKAVVGGGEARFETPRRFAAQPRPGAAVVYDLLIGSAPVRACFLLKTHGGLGRAAAALKELGVPGEDTLVVSHGDWGETSLLPPPRGQALFQALQKLGLEAAAVGPAELSRWRTFQAYRAAHPDGIKFLSADLKDAESPLPATAVFSKGGLRIGVLGLTGTAQARYLGRGALKDVSVEDPVEAARAAVAELRPNVDAVVALSNLSAADDARLEREVPGIDVLVAAGDQASEDETDARGHDAFEDKRAPFAPLLYRAPDLDGVDRLELTVGEPDADGLRRMEARQRHRPLDDSLADAESLAPAVSESTAPLIPPGHKVFPDGRRVTSRDFWTLTAGLMADRTRSEVGLMLVEDAGAPPPGAYDEADVRARLGWDDQLAVFELPGDALDSLLREARSQAGAERRGPPEGGKPRLAAGGVGPGGTVHGTPVDRSLVYKVAGSELLLANAASYPELAYAKNVELRGPLGDAVVGDLRKRAAAGRPPSWYGSLMEGRPVEETPYWTVNVRDLSARFSDTHQVRDSDAFAQVPNSRVTGFDQWQAGFNFQGDLDYRFRGHKWTNTAEVAYSETRLYPRDEPPVIDRTDNRLFGLTSFTERLGSFPWSWLGESVGPSLGLQYDGEVKRRSPDAKRRNIYALNPGVEIYDGSVVNSVTLSGTLRRDFSVEPPESQYGARLRAVWSAYVPVGHGGRAKLSGELWTNYYFRRRNDLPNDLQLEGDASAKLDIALWKGLSLAPFIDCYWFKLKERPLNGYSLMSGVSLSFSRLWKPQFEKL